MKRTYAKWEPVKNASAKTSYFTFWYAILWLVFLSGIVQSVYSTDFRFLAISGSAIAGAYMLIDRKNAHDELQMIERELYDQKSEIVPPHKPQQTEEPISTHVVTVNAPSQRHIAVGRYKITNNEAKRLQNQLRQNDWKFTRDCVKSANIQSMKRDINGGKWSSVIDEFSRLNFIEDGVCTDNCRSWLAQFTPPLPEAH